MNTRSYPFMTLSLVVLFLISTGSVSANPLNSLLKLFSKTEGKMAIKNTRLLGVTGLKTAIQGSRGTAQMTFKKGLAAGLKAKIDPQRILAVGGAVSLVIVGKGVADGAVDVGKGIEKAVEKVGDASSRTLDGSSKSSQSFFQIIREGTFSVIFFFFLLVGIIAVFLLWRFRLPPWHKTHEKPGSVVVLSPASSVEGEIPVTVVGRETR